MRGAFGGRASGARTASARRPRRPQRSRRAVRIPVECGAGGWPHKNAAYSPLTHELHLDLSNGTRSLRASGGGGTRGAAMSYRELRNFKEIMATLTGPN